VVEDVVLGIHSPFDLMYFVGSVGSVLGHYNGSFEFSVYKVLVVALLSILD
jgi:hypothetical protein